MSRGGKEREKREERREGQNLGVGRHRVGGGREAKSITSLLEQSQKGKDMSQWTDCASLCLSRSSWMGAKRFVFKSPVLELELGRWGSGQWSSVCVQTAGFVDRSLQVQRGLS